MKTKYYSILLFILPALFFSCSAPYQISTNSRLNGDWTVTSAELEGGLAGTELAAPIFEDVTLQCLKTSKWNFFEGGGGSYTVNTDEGGCLKGARKITWEVVTLKGKSHYLQFYRFNAPKGIQTDRFTLYIAELKDLTKKDMVLSYPVKYHDKTGSIVITLTRQK
jgi:hypothetical protein